MHENIVQLKMRSPKAGKFYKTDTLDTKGILRLIESVPSSKAEPFKLWLANLGSERIDEVFNPEIAVNRAVEYYRKRGHDDKWIKAKLTGIVDRFKLTDVWKSGGKVAKGARDLYEKETKKLAVSKEKALNYEYIDEKQIGTKE